MTDSALKLLHVFPSFGIGGQQARLATLVRAFGPLVRHKVVSLDGDVSARGLFASPIETEALVLAKSGGVDRGNLTRLNTAIRSSGARILCTYNFGALEAAAANLAGPRLPHIHQEDGFGPDESPERQKARRVWFRRFLLRGSTTVVPSQTLYDLARLRWRLPVRRLRYIPNGVETARFAAPRARNGRVTVGTVGAFRPEKNYARLIRCFAEAKTDGALTLVGDGPEAARLKALADEAAPGAVAFPGRTDAPEDAYAAFDIFALSSDTEQMPLSLMEAMAAGLPVVATDVGDVGRMVAPVNRPFIVPPTDEKGFAASIAALSRDADLRAALGAANRKVAEERFGLEAMTAAYRDLYFSAMLRR